EGYETIPATVLQGYTVMTGEIFDQLAEGEAPTHIFVQGGVGALAAAVCAHFWLRTDGNRPRIIVVEPEGAACLYASAVVGEVRSAQGVVHSVMAGLECGEPSPLAWGVLAQGAHFFVTIPDESAPHSMRLLATSPFRDRPIVAGESAVAGLAAFLCITSDRRA